MIYYPACDTYSEHDKAAFLAAAQLNPISLETLSESDHENGNDPDMSHSQWQDRMTTRYELDRGQTGLLCPMWLIRDF